MIATKAIYSTSIDEVRAMNIDTNIIITRDERHYCKCAACKKATTFDYEIVVWEFAFYASGDRVAWEPRSTYYRLDGDKKVEVKNTYIAACPHCGAAKPRRSQLKKATISNAHTCGPKCWNATSETCECSCGGHNHGRTYKVND